MRQKNRHEAGEGKLGCLVGLIVLLLALFVAYKMIPVKVKAAELRQTVVDEAKSAGTHNDDTIRAAILAKAKEDGLPVKEENIVIKRGSGNINVQVDYVVPIDFPGKTFEWHIHHEADNPIF